MASHGKRRPKKRRGPTRHELTGRTKEYRLVGTPPPPNVGRLLHELFASGWIRWLKPGALLSVMVEATDDADGAGLASIDRDEPAWWGPGDDPIPEEVSEYESDLAAGNRLAVAAGLAELRTVGDLIDIALHFGLIIRDGDGWQVPFPLPLVSESGVLTAEEVAHEDRVRWSWQFDPIAQLVIHEFVEGKLDRWEASLEEIAAKIGQDVETTRQGLAHLATQEDFTVLPDPERAEPLDPILVTVDWAAFDRSRFSFGGYAEEDEE